MEYHSKRFIDHSLMFFKGNNLIAVMPANIKDKALVSHGGLTFGGIISNKKMTTSLMVNIFGSMIEYVSSIGIKKIVYKAIPHIYHKISAEEDLYALFLNNAKLIKRDISSTVSINKYKNMAKKRMRCIKKSKENGVEIKRSYDFKTFMDILDIRLKEKYEVNPTHTLNEMKLLSNRFPENIKLFSAYKNNEMLAGVIVYESDTVAHTQYIASTKKGRMLSATDLTLDFLIDYYSRKEYFDFGISTEKDGYYLNNGLIQYKESFGARATVYDHYIIDI
jgi:hypothetical protein